MSEISIKCPKRKNPFTNMEISDNSILSQMESRSPCIKCAKSRKYFCYTCFLPVAELENVIPKVKLPVAIDIIKHRNEIDGKSTCAHAPILAPGDVNIYVYPNIPDYSKEEQVVLIFPGAKSVSVSQLFNENIHFESVENCKPKGYNMGSLLTVKLNETSANKAVASSDTNRFSQNYNLDNLPIKKAVFIDSTWNQCRGIYKDVRISSIKTVVIQNRLSQFWRHQKGSPRWYLATIEAIHQFLIEVHINAWGLSRDYKGLDELEISQEFLNNARIRPVCNLPESTAIAPYHGQYDNLLFFFSHMYDLIHYYYDHNKLKSYKRPI